MTSLGAFEDRIAVHLGKQPAPHALVAATQAGAAVLTGVSSRAASSAGIRASVPFLWQHDGAPMSVEPTLFGEDMLWLGAQSGAQLLTTRTAVLDTPGDGAQAAQAVDVANAFIRAATEYEKPVLAVFAVHSRWLTVKAHRELLIRSLARVDSGVALMMGGSARDPLDSAHAVEGLVEAITRLPSVAVLRCDHGALGAYAFGAGLGAIGIGTGTRHFIAPNATGFADTDDMTPRLWVRSLHVWWKGSRLAAHDGDPLFDCFCATCQGASLARFQDEALRPLAELHSINSCLEMAADLQMAMDRPSAWIEMCRQATYNLEALEDQTGLPQPASKQLKAWLRVAGVVVT